MTTPDDEVNLLHREYLESENLEFLKEDFAFAVAKRIVKYSDPDLLRKMPPWLGDMVREMCAVYRRDGSYKVVSNLGEADHSEMVSKLVGLVEPDQA